MASLPLARPPIPRPSTALTHVFLIVVAGLVAYPFYFMVTTAFKDFFEATTTPPTFLPTVWHPENFVEAWNKASWARYFANTTAIAIIVTLGDLVTAVLAAYAFARMSFRGKSVLFTILLATFMLPGEATTVPNFVLMSKRYLGLYDTYAVQILPFLAGAFSIFLMRQFFLAFPNELQDAARIDGAGHLRFLWNVLLPNSVPALITVAIISFLGTWNAFQWPLFFTSNPDIRPIQYGLSAFRQDAGSSYHLLMAAATFTIAPIVLLYLVAQRYIIQGVTRTGIRG